MASDSSILNGDLAAAAGVKRHSDGTLTAQIVEGWDVMGVPHGGYLMAILASAARHVATQQAPLAVAANYLAVPAFGPAQLEAVVVRAGKRQSTVQVRLLQNESGAGAADSPGAMTEKVRATLTMGSLSDRPSTAFLPAAEVPEAAGLDLEGVQPGSQVDEPNVSFVDATKHVADEHRGLIPRLYDHVETRYHPDTGFIEGQFGRPPKIRAWCRLTNDHSTDELALLVYSDGLIPSMVEHRGFTVGHVPTLQLTAYLHGRPRNDWIYIEASTAVRGGNFVEEDYRLWDIDGRLVGSSRQLALVIDQ
jgi:acyl-CoA thioesterase